MKDEELAEIEKLCAEPWKITDRSFADRMYKLVPRLLTALRESVNVQEKLAKGHVDYGDHRDTCPRSWRLSNRDGYKQDAKCNCGFLEVFNVALTVMGEPTIPDGAALLPGAGKRGQL